MTNNFLNEQMKMRKKEKKGSVGNFEKKGCVGNFSLVDTKEEFIFFVLVSPERGFAQQVGWVCLEFRGS